jgi:molecular chaperone GrpE
VKRRRERDGGPDPGAQGAGRAAEPPEAGPAAAAAGEAPTAEAAEDAGVLRDRWLRAEAELQNYRRRAAREREEARRGAEEGAMLEIIAALDDLDRALATARESRAPEAWAEGVRLVAARLGDYLARQGVLPMEPLGQPFDPLFHEGVLEMEDAGVPPGHVAQVILKGWRRGERALRAARVVVARGSDGDA